MTATETEGRKRPEPDIARFKANKHRVNDFFEHSAEAVRKKHTLMTAATVFAEMRWCVEEIERFGGAAKTDDPQRFEKIKAFVARVHDEQGGAIASGAFVKVRADVFGAWRFLVRSLETAYKHHLDVEDQFALGSRMPEKEMDRVVLDLEDGLGDDEPEGKKAKKKD